MSVKVSSWVWHGDECADLTGNELILMLCLADVADDSGRCRYLTEDDDLTYDGLARKARVSRSTIIRLVASLRERGLLHQVKGTKRRSNEFSIVVPWGSRRGVNLTPQADGGVSSEHDSVSSATTFGVSADEHSSLIRKDVGDVSSSEVAVATPRPEIEMLLDLLDSEIERNGGRKPSRTKKNTDACRLLLDRDGRTVEQVAAAIRWCQADEFWRSNILSMSKLREKYEQLRLAAQRQQRRAPSPTERAQETIDIGRRLQAELDARQAVAS